MRTLLILLFGALTMAAQPRAVQLLPEVTVQRESILLSDLLPGEAGAGLQVEAQQVLLGRSPQPGSFRVFTREQLLHRLGDQFEFLVPEQVVVRRFGDTHKQPDVPLRRPTPQALVKSQVPAALVIESDAIRIQLRVVPLRKAGLGETVRVLDPATRRLFVAKVAGPGLLQLSTEKQKAEGILR
jgi:hypothetical protein